MIYPQDWLTVYESHTPYEWLVQTALAIVDPWGDDRADMRAAINTMAVLPGDEGREETAAALTGYLKINEDEEDVDPAVMRKLQENLKCRASAT